MDNEYRLITPAIMAREAPQRWKEQYCKEGFWNETEGTMDKHEIYLWLRKLQDVNKLTPESVARAIGNNSWTSVHCDVCYKENLPKALRVRDEDTKIQSDQQFDVCIDCAKMVQDRLKKGK